MPKKSLLFFSVLFLIVLCQTSAEDDAENNKHSESVEKGLKIFKFIFNGALSLVNLKDVAESAEQSAEVVVSDPELTLDDAVKKLNSKIYKIEKYLISIDKQLKKAEVSSQVRGFSEAVQFVSTNFENLRKISHNEDVSPNEMNTFANKLQNPTVGVEAQLENVKTNFFGFEQFFFPEYKGLIPLLMDYYDIFFKCSTKSQQQYFYDLMIMVLRIEAKGRVLLEWASRKKREINKEDTNKNGIITLSLEYSDARVKTYIMAFENILSNTSRVMQVCDLGKEMHKKDQTFTKFENGFDRILLNYEINTGLVESGKRKIECDFGGYHFNENPQINIYTEFNKQQRQCSKIVECSNPKKNFAACYAKNQTNGPRYEWILEGNAFDLAIDKFIPNRNCESDKKFIFVDTYGGPKKFPACDCICDESNQYFDLKDVTSNINENYVVTGVRFVKKYGNVIYIQIKQGKLLNYGFISKSKWVPINDTTIGEKNDANSFFKLQWPYARGIALKTERAPKNYVITGVRFASEYTRWTYITQHYLNLEIQVTKYVPETGKLDLYDSYWQPSPFPGSFTPYSDLVMIRHVDNDVPIKVANIHERSYKDDIKVFEPTDIATSDAGASTVPYLDIQSVESSGKDVPLAAVGVHHLEAPKSGGYIALHVESFDVMTYFSDVASLDYAIGQ